jgi:hypothetical protein
MKLINFSHFSTNDKLFKLSSIYNNIKNQTNKSTK